VAVGAGLLALLISRFAKYTEYSLYLTTKGCEQRAITSTHRAFMLALRDSLNDAIAAGSPP
jgi:hypothetical protein